MKYSTSALIKAVFAAVVALIGAGSAAANGPDLSHLDLGQWLASIGTALVAGAALLHKPQTKAGSTPNAVAASTVTDVIISATAAHADLVKQAIDGIQAVQKSTGDLTKLIPGGGVLSAVVPGTIGVAEDAVLGEAQVAANAVGMGPLARQVIGLVPRF